MSFTPFCSGWTAWRVVLGFGIVSLAGDMVYEGARSMYGPLLAILGHGLTAVCVPLLAISPFVGGAGLPLAITLILLERTGKATHSPSKSALLAHAAGTVGRGRGFGVHKALDQTGAFAGPLVVAATMAATGAIWPGMLVIAVPGAVSMVVILFDAPKLEGSGLTSVGNDFAVIDGGTSQDSIEQAREQAAAVIAAHPDLTGSLCVDAACPIGAATAIEEAGKVCEIQIGGMDNLAEILAFIQSGTMAATSSTLPRTQGAMSVQMLWLASLGTELPAFVDTGIAFIDESNVAEWIERVDG